MDEIEIGDDEKERAEEGGWRLIEGVGESNDELMEKYVGEEEIWVEELKNGMGEGRSDVEL